MEVRLDYAYVRMRICKCVYVYAFHCLNVFSIIYLTLSMIRNVTGL